MRKHNVLTRLAGRPREPGPAQRAMRLTLVGLLVLPQAVAPATITVTRTDSTVAVGDGCSLREAIDNANDNFATHVDCVAGEVGPDTIVLTTNVTLTVVDNYTYRSDRGLPVISTDVTIDGGYSTIARHGGAPDFGIFAVSSSGTLRLVDTTVSGGYASFAGGIYNFGATTLTNSTLSGNSASFGGGGIFNKGTSTLTNSTVSGNSPPLAALATAAASTMLALMPPRC